MTVMPKAFAAMQGAFSFVPEAPDVELPQEGGSRSVRSLSAKRRGIAISRRSAPQRSSPCVRSVLTELARYRARGLEDSKRSKTIGVLRCAFFERNLAHIQPATGKGDAIYRIILVGCD